jgi:Predicted Na+-dependent transporter
MTLIQANKTLNRLMPIITPLGVVVGLLLGSSVKFLTPFITLLFAVVTFSGAIKLKFKDFISILLHPGKLIVAFVSAHVLAPLVVFLILRLTGFSRIPEATGYILLTATPIAVSSYIWSQILYGNGPLSLAIIFVDTVLSPFVTPLTVRLLTSTDVAIDTNGMMISLFWMVVLPSIIGMICNAVMKEETIDAQMPVWSLLSRVFLFIVIVLNSSKMRPYIVFSMKYVPIALGVVVLIVLTFLVSYAFGRIFCRDERDLVSLTIGGSMRNISASLVLAMAFFPPEAAFPVVFGIVFQQMLIGLVGKYLFRKHIAEAEKAS